MKPELKRIEAALQQAAKQYIASNVVSGEIEAMPELPPPPSLGELAEASARFRVDGSLPTRTEQPRSASAALPTTTVYTTLLTNPTVERAPSLPEFTASQESQRFVALTNSALAINLIQDLQGMVSTWLTALDEVIQIIQGLYEEGPIIDGWLEASNPGDPSTYRLCGLDEDGQLWCRFCPVEQVPDVSLAIARYQRLQILLTRKRSLESQLNTLTESLVSVHGQLMNLD